MKDKQFDYFYCNNCHHLFLYPVPESKIFSEYYEYKFSEGNYRDYNRFSEGKQIGYDTIIKNNLIPRIGSSSKILEIGCGEGFFLKRLNDHGFKDIYGVDISNNAIFQAKKNLRNCSERLFCANELDLKKLFPPQSMDCIVGLDLIEHISSPIIFLTEIIELLTPGGLVVLTTPRLDSFLSNLLKNHWQYFIPLEHIHLFSSNSLRVALSKAGFENLYICGQKRYFNLNYGVSCLEAIYGFHGTMWETLKSGVKISQKIIPGLNIDVGLMMVLARKTVE